MASHPHDSGTSAAGSTSALFASSHRSLLLDCFRVPYVTSGAGGELGSLHAPASGRTATWPRSGGTLGAYRLAGIPLFARALADAECDAHVSAFAGAWHRADPILGSDGTAVTWLWRSSDGDLFLPFDPDEAIENLWSERYLTVASTGSRRNVKALARRVYYRARPLLPRRIQIAMRRAFSRIQARAEFPRWPAETALHDLYDHLLAELATIAAEPLPTIAPWPTGHRWAVVLTHDVETEVGLRNVRLMRDLELAAGLRSSWNVVPRRYPVDETVLDDLRSRGFEIGVHGLHHDGRDLESRETLARRLPEMRAAAQRWGATGFRAPATHRVWEWMPELGFDYDSSYPDSDPFEPQGGGCCSVWPFFNGDQVELPITLVQDHTLFVILNRAGGELWTEKLAFLKDRRGMAMLITHPDYMLDDARLAVYDRLLRSVAADRSAWRALPREVSAWWRRRDASTITRSPSGDWQITGPAATEATLELVAVPPAGHVKNPGPKDVAGPSRSQLR